MFVRLEDGTLLNLDRVLFVQRTENRDPGKQKVDLFIKTERSHIAFNCSETHAYKTIRIIEGALRKDNKL